MITEYDLQEAIAECLGQRNPNSNTCIKLAAYYIIKNSLYPDVHDEEVVMNYSHSQPPTDVIRYNGNSEFADAISGRSLEEVLPIVEELVNTLEIVNPRLYQSVMRRLRE